MIVLSRLRAVREDQAFSMQALSLRSGVAVNTIFRAEHGQPTYPATVRKLAAALGVTPAELRGDAPSTLGRRAATAVREPSAGLEQALGAAERCRAADDLEGAARWEQIAAGIAAGMAERNRVD